MTNNINLLPNDLNKSSGVGFVSMLFKRVSIILVVILFISVAFGVVFVIIQTRNLDNINKKNNELTSQIQKLNQTEQRLFLVKDRISKIETVLGDKTSEESIGHLDQTVSSMSSDLAFKSVKISGPATTLTLGASNSKIIDQFLNFLANGSSAYTQVLLKNLGYNADLGYLVDLQLF
ncbi:MAG: hypothetical protein HY044_04005 [Candidatus Woesebacteria bacterium]|nr:MAG: hypothetical protein HY044_04005 [Candidatus Woesebacteria bacterium]